MACTFSVIAPNLNEMPYITDFFLSSLHTQQLPPHEIIIVDGGSTDGSENYASFTCTIRNIGYCRDLAAKKATGDIILSASTDVYYPHDTLMKLSKAFNDEKVSAVSGRILPHHGGIKFRFAYEMFELYRQASGNSAPSASLYAVRRSILEAVGGYPHKLVKEGEKLGELIHNYSRVNHLKTLHQSDLIGWHHVKTGERSILDYSYLFLPWMENIQGRRFSSK